MDGIIDADGFFHIPRALSASNRRGLAEKILVTIALAPRDGVKRHEYAVNGKKWTVYDGSTFKMTFCEDRSYNCFFSKTTGLNVRFGKTVEEDPEYCELGPEILDLECVTGFCKPVPGCPNCKYCYKGNTSSPGQVMPFETFRRIVDSFPKNLSQIAFGITSLHGNPDLARMFEYCRSSGIVPNVTTVGSDLDDGMRRAIAEFCGAVAVSCYTGAKEHCYGVIEDLYSFAKERCRRDLHVNMHVVLSADNMDHVRGVLRDVAEKKVRGLKSVVFLRIKPAGRAKNMDCRVTRGMYRELVTYCIDNGISFGFDSCSAVPVMEVLEEIGRADLAGCCEKCESSKLSSYINVKGEYWGCSFAERTDFIRPVDVLKYGSATEWWNGEEVRKARFCADPACRSCPVYDLD